MHTLSPSGYLLPSIALLQRWGTVQITPEIDAFSGASIVSGNYRGTLIIAIDLDEDGIRWTSTAEILARLHRHVRRARGCLVLVVAAADEDDARALLDAVCGQTRDATVWVV